MKAINKWFSNKILLSSAQDLRLHINHATYGQIPPFHNTDTYPSSRLYFCIDDCGEIKWPNKKNGFHVLSLPGHSITYIPPSINLTYHFSTGRMVAFHFNLEIFPGIDVFNQNDHCQQFLNYKKNCQNMYSLMQESNSLNSIFQIQAEILYAISLFAKGDPATIRQQVALLERYKTLLEFLETSLDAKLTISDIAKALNKNSSQLSKAFQRHLGLSLKKYLTNRLVQQSNNLLLSGKNVKETAYILNFSSEFYFSRFFLKHTGLNPSDFRRRFCNIQSKSK